MIQINKYDSLYWGEYKGKPQIVVGSIDRDGKVRLGDDGKYLPQFITKKVGDVTKTFPLTISFDSKEAAIEGLKKMIGELQSPF